LLRDYEYWYLTDSTGKEIRIKIHPYLKASTGEFLKDAAVEGMGISLLPSFIAYKEIERGALVPVLKNYKIPQIDAYAIYPQTRHLSQRVRAFVDFLVKRFEGTPYWDFCLKKPAA
jgi:DNA-binding transcriptional LysR family regulator